MIFLNILFNCKSKYFNKSAIPENEKKQKKLTCESNASENYEQNITIKIKQKNTLP